MPPPAILDPATLDFSRLVADRADIMRVNPHRHEFALLDGVLVCDLERGLSAGYHDVRTDAWWVRAHVPGRPLFPGVLMIETAAQLCSYLTHALHTGDHFVGLTGVDDVKYRGIVEPPCRFVVIGKLLKASSRRTRTAMQGFVDGAMVFEAVITGMVV